MWTMGCQSSYIHSSEIFGDREFLMWGSSSFDSGPLSISSNEALAVSVVDEGFVVNHADSDAGDYLVIQDDDNWYAILRIAMNRVTAMTVINAHVKDDKVQWAKLDRYLSKARIRFAANGMSGLVEDGAPVTYRDIIFSRTPYLE